jgi:alkanesulfonate monooxygenase SsuD/methylene tetrahydromethanopterin reductase-like flavin-dependent oxidoreductase (luciferase family)
MLNDRLDLGLMFSFRNPAAWTRPFNDVYRDELDLIADAEELGFDTIWLTEHHFADDGYSPSIIPLAAAIAARTERVRIGFNLPLLPLHNAIRVAEDIATLDVLSGGRIDVGLGQG